MSKASKVKDNIKLLVQAEPQVTRNYNLLVVRYWMKFEGANDFNDVLGCTSAESITRAFRALVSEGHVALDKDIAEQRNKQESEFKQVYGGKPRQGFIDLSGSDL